MTVTLAPDAPALPRAPAATDTCVVTISFFRFDGLVDRLWVFGQMGLARFGLARTPGIGFHKLMGTGTGLGFRPAPNFGVWTILAVWPSEAAARDAVEGAPTWRRWRARAAESWTVFMAPVAARGVWAGVAPFRVAETPPPAGARLAVLTRATVKPRRTLEFWKRVPAIEDALGEAPDVRFHIGMGEVPWLHQVTFSIWDDEATMHAFAHAAGPHRDAVRAAYDRGWFTESLFARFAVTGWTGSWNGAAPL